MDIWSTILRWTERRPREGDSLPVSDAHTNESDAQSLAANEAASQGYPWRPPVTAQLISHEGRARWFLRYNAGQRGSGMLVIIDDETREIVRTQTQPR